MLGRVCAVAGRGEGSHEERETFLGDRSFGHCVLTDPAVASIASSMACVLGHLGASLHSVRHVAPGRLSLAQRDLQVPERLCFLRYTKA